MKAALTVRANENAVGIRPKPFKIYRELNGKLIIPRFYDTSITPPKLSEGEAMNLTFNGTLRPHQSDALKKFKGNGVLCLPCGQGKTITALAICAKMKKKTLIIVHKEFLASQWTERIGQFFSDSSIGLIQGSKWDTDGHQFVIAMIQTLCTREFAEDAFDIFGMVVIDEAHHIGAPAFSQVMLRMTPKYTLGLSATPERKDGLTRILYWFLGPAFYTLENAPENFEINKVDFDDPIAFRQPPHITKIGKICMSTMVTELTTIDSRNALILKLIKSAQERGRKSLVLSDRRIHCEYLYSNLDPEKTSLHMGGTKGFPCVGGGTLISTFSLAYEGLDIPELDTIFLCTPHSDIKQAVGRITRSKTNCKEIWDIVDNWSIFKTMWYKRKKIYDELSGKKKEEEECLFSQ
jgi:superfamily II DNA or RNA helicase